MTSQYTEARKRVEAILADWEVAVSIPGDPAVIALFTGQRGNDHG